MTNLCNLCPNGQSLQDTACVDVNYPDKHVRVSVCTFRQSSVLIGKLYFMSLDV